MRDSECNHTVSYIEKGANRVQTYTAHAADCPHCLRREIERLQAENKTMQALHFAVGKCNREDVPASVYSAWEAPESYYQCELYQAHELQAAMADIVDCSRKAIHTGDYVTSVSHIFHVAANATGGKR